jgi:hypothetical protein
MFYLQYTGNWMVYTLASALNSACKVWFLEFLNIYEVLLIKIRRNVAWAPFQQIIKMGK